MYFTVTWRCTVFERAGIGAERIATCNILYFRKTGLLILESSNGSEIPESITAMKRHNWPYEELSNTELVRRYPQLRYPDDYLGLLDESAGLLIPDTCLAALQVSNIEM